MDRSVAQLIAYLQVGGTHGDDAVRRVGEVRPPAWGPSMQPGWRGYIDRVVRPAYQWGARRFMLWCPFGLEPGNRLAWDGLLGAQLTAPHLAEDFVHCWWPVIAGSLGEPVEVIAYIGNPKQSAAMEALRRFPHRWFEHAYRSIEPMILARMDIAIDASASIEREHPTVSLVQVLRDLYRVKVYAETRPIQRYPQWAEVDGCVCDDDFWRKPDATEWAIPSDEIRGEVIRGVFYEAGHLTTGTNTPPSVNGIKSSARSIIADGHTPLFDPSILIRAGVPMNAIL